MSDVADDRPTASDTPSVQAPPAGVSRRRLLQGAAAAGLGLGGLELEPSAAAAATSATSTVHPARRARAARRPGSRSHDASAAPAPPVTGIHLQFGAHASRQMIVTWQTYAPVTGAQVQLYATSGRALGWPTPASTETYADPVQPAEQAYVHSASLTGLQPDTEYVYVVSHDGADSEVGDFTTAPEGRAAFTFTSYGDQGTPTVTAPTGLAAPAPAFKNDNLGSPAAGDVTSGVEQVAPLFHLVNGDLCYANLSTVPVRCWSDWFANNSRSARFRPWMPCAGNHENEALGTTGFEAFQTYFALPSNGSAEFQNLWYSFRVGSVKVIALNNDDVCLQDAGSSYVHGYSGGQQKTWLENELAAARAHHGIDWIVVCMHQVAMSSAIGANGADLGIRQEWMPLFDQYGVDLVVCGHEHHYERTQPVRGTNGSMLLTPQPVSESGAPATIDTTQGTVHMVIGGGGTSAPSNQLLSTPPMCQVITSVGPGRGGPVAGAPNGHLTPNYSMENAIWASVRDEDWSYGFAAFAVDPGAGPGAQTSIDVTYYRALGFGGDLQAYDAFTLVRPRSDG